MRHGLVSLVPVVLAAALALPTAFAAREPSITFRHYAPLTLSGAGFSAERAVRVSVSWTGGSLEKRLRTDEKGRFHVAWPTSVKSHICQGLVAVVVTPAGRRVTARPPAVLCGIVPVPTPPTN
jgi:hypothetical protein